MHTKYVLVTFHNGGNFLYHVSSKLPITMDRLVAHFEETEGWSEGRDNIEIMDEIANLSLDPKDKPQRIEYAIKNALTHLNKKHGRGTVISLNLSNPLESGLHHFTREWAGSYENRVYHIRINSDSVTVRAFGHQKTEMFNKET